MKVAQRSDRTVTWLEPPLRSLESEFLTDILNLTICFILVLLHLDNFGWAAVCFENWPNLSCGLPTVVKTFAVKPLAQEHSDRKVPLVFT